MSAQIIAFPGTEARRVFRLVEASREAFNAGDMDTARALRKEAAYALERLSPAEDRAFDRLLGLGA